MAGRTRTLSGNISSEASFSVSTPRVTLEGRNRNLEGPPASSKSVSHLAEMSPITIAVLIGCDTRLLQISKTQLEIMGDDSRHYRPDRGPDRCDVPWNHGCPGELVATVPGVQPAGDTRETRGLILNASLPSKSVSRRATRKSPRQTPQSLSGRERTYIRRLEAKSRARGAKNNQLGRHS